MNFVAVCSQRRADRADKLSFGHGEQQFISRSNPAQAPAPAPRFAVHFIAIKRRPRIDFKVLVTWASHPWLQSTCIGRHRNALAYSPCLALAVDTEVASAVDTLEVSDDVLPGGFLPTICGTDL
jgi:hypothetical protein